MTWRTSRPLLYDVTANNDFHFFSSPLNFFRRFSIPSVQKDSPRRRAQRTVLWLWKIKKSNQQSEIYRQETNDIFRKTRRIFFLSSPVNHRFLSLTKIFHQIRIHQSFLQQTKFIRRVVETFSIFWRFLFSADLEWVFLGKRFPAASHATAADQRYNTCVRVCKMNAMDANFSLGLLYWRNSLW